MPIGPSDDFMTGAIKKVRGENPNMAGTSIEPAGWLGNQILSGLGASGVTNPMTGSIIYDPAAYQQMSPDLRENSLTHELAHAKQIQDMSYWNRLSNLFSSFLTPPEPYNERPNEMGAFQAERDRSLSRGLNLPDPVTGRTDIQLPSPKRRR